MGGEIKNESQHQKRLQQQALPYFLVFKVSIVVVQPAAILPDGYHKPYSKTRNKQYGVNLSVELCIGITGNKANNRQQQFGYRG